MAHDASNVSAAFHKGQLFITRLSVPLLIVVAAGTTIFHTDTMMKSFHSGISLPIIFFPVLISAAQLQRFSWTRRRKEEHSSRSRCDARKAKRNICVPLRDRRQFFCLCLLIVLRDAIG